VDEFLVVMLNFVILLYYYSVHQGSVLVKLKKAAVAYFVACV